MEIYLDHASTTIIHPDVLDVMNESCRSFYGNPSSLHYAGYQASQRINLARETLLRTVNGHNYRLIFTSGGTEANNLAIMGLVNQHRLKSLQWVCSEIEHPSVLKVYDHLHHLGAQTAQLPVNRSGTIDLNKIDNVVNEKTCLVSLMHVNNETGIIQPLEEAISLIRKKAPKALIHVDGVQAYGRVSIDLQALNTDMYTISSHKIKGPRGIGALILHRKVKLEPIFWGGGQESDMRPGTENTPGILGFEKAALIRHTNLLEYQQTARRIRLRLLERLKEIEGLQVVEHSDTIRQVPQIVTVCVEHCKSEVILRMLSDDGIYISAGSACSSKKTSASHVLTAMKVKPAFIEGAFRISFDETFNEEEQDFFISRFKHHLKQMNRITKR